MILQLFFLAVVVYTLVNLSSPRRRHKNVPPGPFPLPIIGNLHHLAVGCLNDYLHKATTKITKKYGDFTSFWFGDQYAVFVSSPSAIKDLMNLPQTSMIRFVSPFIPARAFGQTNLGIIWNQDESWREIRRFTVRALKDFGFGKKQGIEYFIHQEIKDVLESIKETRDASTGVWALDEKNLSTLSLNTVLNYAAGFRIPKTDPRLKVALDYGDWTTKAMGPRNVYTTFPWAATWFPKLSQYEAHSRQFKIFGVFIADLIEDIRANWAKNGNPEPTTLVEAFLDEIDKHKGENGTVYTDEQLNVILQDLFLPGVETTTKTMAWMILYLSLHPEVQKKVYQEVMEVIGPDGVAELSMDQQLVYGKATIMEVHRMACIFPNVPRYVSEPINYKGYTFPKGTNLIANLDSVFHSKEVWGDPENFRPERFVSTSADGTKKLINADKVPIFGFGRRICPAESVANTTLLFFLTSLVQKMEWTVVPGKEPSLLPLTTETITIGPQPYSVKMTYRK